MAAQKLPRIQHHRLQTILIGHTSSSGTVYLAPAIHIGKTYLATFAAEPKLCKDTAAVVVTARFDSSLYQSECDFYVSTGAMLRVVLHVSSHEQEWLNLASGISGSAVSDIIEHRLSSGPKLSVVGIEVTEFSSRLGSNSVENSH